MATKLDQAVTKNLECPICFSHFSEPKLLDCSHTFCKDCLVLLYRSQPHPQSLSCPVCRKITIVQGGDVSTLQTNIPLKSLVEAVVNTQLKAKTSCTNCDTEEKPPAESYCQNCEEFMCASCHDVHANWKKNCGHEVLSMRDIESGRSSIRRRRKCRTHPADDAEEVCVDCKTYVCRQCSQDGDHRAHDVVDAKEHEENHKKNIESLQQEADLKELAMRDHIEVVEEQRSKVEAVLAELTKDIKKAFEESVQQLEKRRDALMSQCEGYMEELTKSLEDVDKDYRKRIAGISSARELVGNGLKVPLESQALIIHNALCKDLEEILGREEPDDTEPKSVTRYAEALQFRRFQDVLRLGSVIERRDRMLPEDAPLHVKLMSIISESMPDG